MDATVAAVPGYFATMGAEYRWLRRRAEREGPSAADYERRDTITSLTMGVGSLLAPILVPKLLEPITPGVGRYGKVLLTTAAALVAATTVADRLARIDPTPEPTLDLTLDDPVVPDPELEPVSPRRRRRRTVARAAKRAAAAGGIASVVTGGIAISTMWSSRSATDRMWKRRLVRDLGRGPVAVAVAVFGWDFIYYWNHRFMHESRYMWAVHVVHHSSERYNLSTALRQPVADALGTFAPYGILALFGVRPALIAQARGINLLYQYWIHTDTIRRLGPFERVFNTPSHHRVHHGSNQQYLDRNHGSILILWDRLFGTFEEEREPVVYGLTKNVDSFNPARVISNEHVDMLRDVGQSSRWSDRLSFVLRGPGWAYRRHAEQDRESVLVRISPPGAADR